MKKDNIKNYIKGWIIGDFLPSIYKNKDFEIGIKYYNNGDYEQKHVHKYTKEITFVVNGKVIMNDIELSKGDFLILEKNEACDFKCIADNTSTVVIKIPSNPNDKFIC